MKKVCPEGGSLRYNKAVNIEHWLTCQKWTIILYFALVIYKQCINVYFNMESTVALSKKEIQDIQTYFKAKSKKRCNKDFYCWNHSWKRIPKSRTSSLDRFLLEMIVLLRDNLLYLLGSRTMPSTSILWYGILHEQIAILNSYSIHFFGRYLRFWCHVQCWIYSSSIWVNWWVWKRSNCSGVITNTRLISLEISWTPSFELW